MKPGMTHMSVAAPSFPRQSIGGHLKSPGDINQLNRSSLRHVQRSGALIDDCAVVIRSRLADRLLYCSFGTWVKRNNARTNWRQWRQFGEL